MTELSAAQTADAPRAFVDFYTRNGISPVSQDLSDIERHWQRRDSLYRFLGLPPAFLQGRSVLEFGPGSGHNALFTARLRPARYLLVDANPKAVADTHALLRRYGLDGPCELAQAFFEEFDSAERFDLVLAEGCLSFQREPAALLRRLARFTRPGGLLVITTMSPLSFLAEMARRLIRDVLIAPGAPASEQLALLRPILMPHLETLPGRSRPVDDWILDNVVQPIYGELLSIPEAIAALQREFDVYGASPHFATDFRWYKSVTGDERGFNARASEEYFRRTVNLADHRIELPPQEAAFGRALEGAATDVWQAMQSHEHASKPGAIDAATAGLRRVAGHMAPLAAPTATALLEIADSLDRRAGFADLKHFPALWGRGQQYLSFIRRGS